MAWWFFARVGAGVDAATKPARVDEQQRQEPVLVLRFASAPSKPLCSTNTSSRSSHWYAGSDSTVLSGPLAALLGTTTSTGELDTKRDSSVSMTVA